MKKKLEILIVLIVITLLIVLTPNQIYSNIKVAYSKIIGSNLQVEYDVHIQNVNASITKEKKNYTLLGDKDRAVKIKCDSMYVEDIGFREGVVYTIDSKYDSMTQERVAVAYADVANSKYYYNEKLDSYSWTNAGINFQYFVKERKLYYKENGSVVEKPCTPY